ncbi:MAG: RNA polymerase sigma factor [Bacteroidetes bacterium]|nr:RNA polymerase sigma factor [Bacteroidota bacterium]
MVRLNDRRILQVAHGILGNMQDASDAYQEGLIRAYRNLHTFRRDAAFGTWLTRIVINQALNLKKKRRWKQRFPLDDTGQEASLQVLDPASGPEEILVSSELSAEIRAGLDLLSDRERTVFVLKHMHGYRLREIAVMIECAEGTVKNYLFRATQKLRDALGHHASASGERTTSSS